MNTPIVVGKTYFVSEEGLENNTYPEVTLNDYLKDLEVDEGDEYFVYEITVVRKHKVTRVSKLAIEVIAPAPTKAIVKKTPAKKKV